MSACEQEMCPYWDGWGCDCACYECGSLMSHDSWDGWFCPTCGWEENPL